MGGAGSAAGRWRLTVRAPDGAVTTPAIADFGAPPRAQIGSTGFAVAGRRLLAVYSRCQGASATAGCDVYAFDLRAGTEERIAQLSSRSYSETAPSIELGRIAFVRRGGGPRPGLYYYALGSKAAPKRLTSTLARETATNGTRVAYTYNSSRGGGLAVRQLSGHGSALVPVSRRPAVPRSPLLTRYNASWLLRAGTSRPRSASPARAARSSSSWSRPTARCRPPPTAWGWSTTGPARRTTSTPRA